MPAELAGTTQKPPLQQQEKKPTVQLGKSGKKICCSCPETKKARDLCIVENGEDKCAELIEAHKICLRAEGFTVK